MTTESHGVVIVGAGIVGAACALALAESDERPLLVDASPPGTGATAEGMGHLLALDHDAATLALSARSLALWRARAPGLPACAEWGGAGTLWIAERDEGLARAHARAEALEAAGVAVERLGRSALAALEPALADDLAGALRVPGDRIVYPPAAALAFIERAVALGATTRFGDRGRVSALERGGARPRLRLADGATVIAERVVLAAGLASARLLGPPFEAAVTPRRGHLVITDRHAPTIRHQLVELGYHDSVAARGRSSVAFNLQPRRTGQLLLGSSRQDDCEDRGVDLGVLARMVARGERFVPALGAVQAVRAWVGLRPATADGLPVIGPLPDQPALVLAFGHEGLGITTALATAELVAAELLGSRPAIDPRPYLPRRILAPGARHVTAALHHHG